MEEGITEGKENYQKYMEQRFFLEKEFFAKGTFDITVTMIENGIGDPSSNPG